MTSTTPLIRLAAMCLLMWSDTLHAESGRLSEATFRLIGARGQLWTVRATGTLSQGLVLTTDAGRARCGIVAADIGDVTFVHHSFRVGQLALVPLHQGGGTGASYPRFVVVAADEDGPHVLADELYEQISASRAALDHAFRISTAFRAAEGGFLQIVSIETPADETFDKWNAVAQVEVRHSFRRTEGVLEHTRSVSRPSSLQLLRLLRQECQPVQSWAASVIAAVWPETRETVVSLPKHFDPRRFSEVQRAVLRTDEPGNRE
ncbi:MAG: hypothetical protein KY476_11410 [Planctomycetes bacterium]|nr:hypothetical protein [Planctomycetota bacterium]